ncbi:MAG: hypothetical protein GF329_22000 [Candidatus Lokiarchaeota archaeon]|nr:hypothetical protein [Candidatus Lokiarchaeota archaeon]
MISLPSKIVIFILIVSGASIILFVRRRWYIVLFALLGTFGGFVIETLGVFLNLWGYGQKIAILGVPPVIYIGWFFTMLVNGIITFCILNYLVDRKRLNYSFYKNTKRLNNLSFMKIIFMKRYKYILATTLITWLIGCGIEFYGVNQKIWSYIPLGYEIFNVPMLVLFAWACVMFIIIAFFYYIIENKIRNKALK